MMDFEKFQTFVVQQATKEGPIAPPIVHSASFAYGSPEMAEAIFAGKAQKPLYARMGNPTNAQVEKILSFMDGGAGAILTSSGMGAISLVLLAMLQSGDEVVAVGGLFGGSFALFYETLTRFGIKIYFAKDSDDVQVNENTKAIFCESIGNPNGVIVDFTKLKKIAEKNGLLFIIDNTLTPLLFEPLKYADIALYSTTKILSGHSQALGGAVVFRKVDEKDPLFEKFPFLKNFYDQAGPNAFLPLLKKRALRDIGMSQNAFNASLTLLGLETLALRIRRVSDSAQKIARHFDSIANYAGFHPRAKHYLPQGAGQMLTFDLGSKERVYAFLKSSQMVYITANLGDARTLALAMDTTIYRDFSKEQKHHLGISEGLVRLSIGLESSVALIEDFEKALKGSI